MKTKEYPHVVWLTTSYLITQKLPYQNGSQICHSNIKVACSVTIVFHPSSSYDRHIDVESIRKMYGDGMASEITFISSFCNLM
jgi:hypothetical protein